MPLIISPYINPLEFYQKGFTSAAQFNSKHINDVPFEQQIYPWQQRTTFSQQWQLNDSIKLQFRSELGPVLWRLYNASNGQLVNQDSFDQILENADNPGEFIYEADIALSIYEAGCYYFEVDFGDGEFILISERLEFSILSENSLLLRCSNSSFRDDVIFETGIEFDIRIKGRLQYKTPASKDVVYEDQVLNETIVDSKVYDLWELQMSNERGIPDWMIRKLNGLLACDMVVIDGRTFTKSEGAKLEETKQDRYPMRGWKIELREQLNRRSKYFSTEGSTNEGFSMILNTDSKGFVEEETGGSEFQILDIN